MAVDVDACHERRREGAHCLPFIELTMVTAQVVSSLLDLHVNGVVNCSDRCIDTNCFADGEDIHCKRALFCSYLGHENLILTCLNYWFVFH